MKYLSILFAFMFCLSACELETSHNGKLDGWWLLTAVDTLQTGGHANVEAQQCTWAFQGRLLELRDVPGQCGDYLLSFAQHGDDLLLSHPYLSARDSGDIAFKPYPNSSRLSPSTAGVWCSPAQVCAFISESYSRSMGGCAGVEEMNVHQDNASRIISRATWHFHLAWKRWFSFLFVSLQAIKM